MAVGNLPAMRSSPKFIFFTDFDGTITLSDSNDFMTDNYGYGKAKRQQGNKDTLDGKVTFRESFQGMMDSISTPFNELLDALVQNIKLDPYFNEFLSWSVTQNIPVVVLTGGMTPVVRTLLRHLVGPEVDKIEIVSNDVRVKPGKSSINEHDGWDVVFHDTSEHGHDKSLTIRPYAALPESQRPVLFYAGDGVSDLSAAKETDLLFAKRGRDLVTYCVRQEIPFTVFDDWSEIKKAVMDIVSGEMSVKDAAHDGYQRYKKEQSGSGGGPH